MCTIVSLLSPIIVMFVIIVVACCGTGKKDGFLMQIQENITLVVASLQNLPEIKQFKWLK